MNYELLEPAQVWRHIAKYIVPPPDMESVCSCRYKVANTPLKHQKEYV